MTFATGTCTSLYEFADLLCDFAVANTSMVDGGEVSGTANVETTTSAGSAATIRYVSLGSVRFCFGFAPGFRIRTGSNFATSSDLLFSMKYADPISGQVFNRSTAGGEFMSAMGIYDSPDSFSSSYFFISSSNCVHGILEVFPGVFSHLSFGQIDKAGTWDGGEYMCATYLAHKDNSSNFDFDSTSNRGYLFDYDSNDVYTDGCGYVRVARGSNNSNDFDPLGSADNNVSQASRSDARMAISKSWGTLDVDRRNFALDPLFSRSPTTFNSRSILIPINVYIRDVSVVSERRLYAGCVSGARVVNMRDSQPKEIIDSDWMVFPLSSKNGDTAIAPDSENIGIAYLIS